SRISGRLPVALIVVPVGIVTVWPAMTQASIVGRDVNDAHTEVSEVLMVWVNVTDDTGRATQMLMKVPRHNSVGAPSWPPSPGASPPSADGASQMRSVPQTSPDGHSPPGPQTASS